MALSQIAEQVVSWLIPTLLGAIAGWLGGMLGAAKHERAAVRDRDDALADGVRSLLRCELVQAHERYVLRGELLDVETLEYIQRTYDSYHRLGGNGIGTHLYNQIVQASDRSKEH